MKSLAQTSPGMQVPMKPPFCNMRETICAFDVMNIRLSQTKIILPEEMIIMLMAVVQCRCMGNQPYLGYNTSLTLCKEEELEQGRRMR